MGEVQYMISEAAKRVDVETHVLRYWEEELELPVERTEKGRRYYTEEDIQLFRCIKELKEQGVSLKELKGLVPDMIRTKRILKAQKKAIPQEVHTDQEGTSTHDQNLRQVQDLMGEVLRRIVEENNKVLGTMVSDAVSGKVVKEMDFLLQAKDRQEEERFQKLDQLIRQQQTMRREAGKVSPLQRWKRLFEA